MKIPFHKPNLPKSLNNIFPKTVQDGWLTTGPQVAKFEASLCEYLDVEHVVAVNSCTAGLHLALLAKNFKQGDYFIAPTYTFVASVEVGEYLGMTPELVDCDQSYNIDLNQIEDKLKVNNKIKCIIPVHFAGNPVNMKEIIFLSEKYNLFVLEDAAHALEAKSNIGKVGITKDACVFSFYANKNITTGGEGGAVATNNEKLASDIRQLSLHGMSKDGWNRFKLGGKWAYDVSKLGYKYNMTDIAASFGLWQMEFINSWYTTRKKHVLKYRSYFSTIDGVQTQKKEFEDEINAYHLFIVSIIPEKWKINRNQLISFLNDRGIGTSVHYIPVHLHSYYEKKYSYTENEFPMATKLSKNVVSLPLYPSLEDKHLDYILEVFDMAWKENRI